MTTFRPDTSFPYLKIAREYGIEYWRVLWWAELLESEPPKQSDWSWIEPWQSATAIAFLRERDRRAVA